MKTLRSFGQQTPFRVGTALVLAFALGLAGFSLLWAAGPSVVLDTFETAQTTTQDVVGSTQNTAVDGANILGTQREISLTNKNGGTFSVISNYTYPGSPNIPGTLSFNAGSGTRGVALIVWDGEPSGDAMGVVNLGASPIADLTQYGNDAIAVELISGDADLGATFMLYGATVDQCSSQTIVLPPHNPDNGKRLIVFPLDKFTLGSGCSTTADASSVYAVALRLTNTGDADVTFDLMQTSRFDYGDLPEQASGYNYGMTTLANDGAAHSIGDLFLGAAIDAESNGQPDADIKEANADDNTGTSDEDGVSPITYASWVPGTNGGSVKVVSSGEGCLSAWIDFGNSFGSNSDNSFDQTGDAVITNTEVTTGTQIIQFNIPSGFSPTGRGVYTRFRLFERNSEGGCPATTSPYPYDGQYTNGEVEDYWWDVSTPTAVTLSGMTAKTPGSNLALSFAGIISLAAVAVVIRKRR